MKRLSSLLALLLVLCLCLGGCDAVSSLWEKDRAPSDYEENDRPANTVVGFASVEGIPDYSGEPYVVLGDNKPQFTSEELTTTSYEYYSELDFLSRCGYTMACVGKDLMPTEERESISSVKPSGWVNKYYDTSLVEGGYLYNRCHLIGFQLTGENANKENLITGTRYMNVDGMLPFEDMVADYVKDYENHVMYRVTPIFEGRNLVANGVLMEAYSVEDEGEGVCFCVYVYNVQPGIVIDYRTGESVLDSEFEGFDTLPPEEDAETDEDGRVLKDYVLNKSSKKFHDPDCKNAADISEKNREDYHGAREDLIDDGYSPCGSCKP